MVEYFERSYRPARLTGRSADTLVAYRGILGHAERWIPGASVALEDSDVDGYLLAMVDSGRYSAATINKHRRHVLAVVGHARRKMGLGSPPDVRPVRESIEEPTAWSIEEMGSILAAAGATSGTVGDVPGRIWWPALILFIYDTGTRITACMRVRTADLAPDLSRVYFAGGTTKNGRGRWRDLHPQTRALLRQVSPWSRLERLWDDWPYDRTVRAWPALITGLRRILRRAGLACGPRDLFHRFRRTTGTWIAAKRGIAAACEILDHSGTGVTARYIDPRYAGGLMATEILPRPSMGHA